MIPILAGHTPEEAVLKGRSMYTWYKATKKFKLARKGITTLVKPGESVGVPAAKSSKLKQRIKDLEAQIVYLDKSRTLYADLSEAFGDLYNAYEEYDHEEEIILAAAAYKKGIRCEIVKVSEEDEDY